MEMGALMYGYAIEAHIKCSWALFENSALPKELNGHNFKDAFETAAHDGHFSDVEIPHDLLDFAHDHFHRRYPQQTHSSARWAKKAGRCLALTPSVGVYLEKFIILLDDSITKAHGDSRVSILSKAAHDCESQRGKDFFSENVPALKRLDLIIGYLGEEISTLEKSRVNASDYDVHIQHTRNTIALMQQLKVNNELLINSPCVDLNSFSNPGIPNGWYKA